ncbi:hypothetical protein O7635_23105 [Asanoa sp. WMMD1127]|uniref:hypothetical protein n=1 Tax=Asanoa sp. WMMD1127 TaxID=3016107 RepID=UPI002417B1BB|nr:hypothetical protein [Asanoa sp. WMMD1127]MDG4824749.1 hypothetical protein [Asanoa sp. WMMD1127]
MRALRRMAAAAVLATLGAVAGVAGVAGPAQAAASVPTTATPGTPPSGGWTCNDSPDAQSCFKWYGDQWWLKSDSNWPATITWVNELRDYNGTYREHRRGTCEGSELARGRWGVCNMDYWESSNENEFGGHGSRLRWYVCAGFCSTEATRENNG